MSDSGLDKDKARTIAAGRIAGALHAPIKFEPHNLAGRKFEGEEMPFGYLSTSPTPHPIFELRTLLDFGDVAHRATAHKLARAYNSFDAMQAALIDLLGEHDAATWPQACKKAEAALALARGEKE